MATIWLCGILRNNRRGGTSRGVLRCLITLGCAGFGLGAQAQGTVPAAASGAPAAAVAPTETPRPAAASGPAPAVVPAAGAWALVRTLRLPNPGAASLDRRGGLYVADADNNVRQFGPEGLPLNTYAPPQPGHVAQLEAFNLNTTLVFYDDRQQLVLLDRFLTPLSELRLADYLDGTVRVATLAPDNQIWLLDESTLTLREFDPGTLRLVQSTPLDLLIGRTRPDFRFIRQYQNNTYLVDKTTGIYVFDNLGNYKKKLPLPGLSTVGFRGDELYYLAGDELRFFHLYNLTERAVALPPTGDAGPPRQVLVGEQFAYLFTAQGVAVYRLPF